MAERNVSADHVTIWRWVPCVAGDKRAFSVNLVGPDGSALIEYMYEAMERHNQVRADLEKNGIMTKALYSPTLRRKTQDMVQCDHVDVVRS